MKKKDERNADLGLKQLGITPRIYHFTIHVKPFTAITIVTSSFSWNIGRLRIDEALTDVWNHKLEPAPATRTLRFFRAEGIYGISICDSSDHLNRQRGRTIAKGRLLKHLKQEAEK